MDKQIKVLFIDNDSDRLEHMVKAFSQFPNVKVYRYGNNSLYEKDFQFNDWEPKEEGLEYNPDIIFRHGRENYPTFINKNKSKLKVCYGGYEGNDPDSQEEEENIYRAIMNMNYIVKEEAMELIDYIQGASNSKPRVFLPSTFDEELEERLKKFHDDYLDYNDKSNSI